MIKKVTFKLFLAIFLLNCGFVFSQNPGEAMGIDFGTPHFAPDKQPVIIPYQKGGHVYGINNEPTYEFDMIAQGYSDNLSDVQFGEIAFLVGAKTVKNANSNLVFTIYNTSPTGAMTAMGDPTTGPGNSYGSGSFKLGDVQITSSSVNFNYVKFTNPITFSGEIIVGVDFSELVTNGDGIGFVSDNPGSGLGLRLAFHHTSIFDAWIPSDELFQVAAGQGLNDNIAIFPVIYDPNESINDMKYVFNAKAVLYPNPAKDNATLSVDFKNNADKAKVEIIDSKGSVIRTYELGNLSSGQHDLKLDLSDLTSGNYYYSVSSAKSQRYIKKFAVIK